MAYPRRPYMVLIFGPVVIALAVLLTVREFETGRSYFRGGHFDSADNPVGFYISFAVSVIVTLVLFGAWCVLVGRILRARRQPTSPKRR